MNLQIFLLTKAHRGGEINSSNREITSCSNCDINRVPHITKIWECSYTLANLSNPGMKNTSAQDLVIAITFVNEREETNVWKLEQPYYLLKSNVGDLRPVDLWQTLVTPAMP